jgi:hypothetical protein
VRLLFLLPDLRRSAATRAWIWLERHRLAPRIAWKEALWTTVVFGGTLNIMRHCALARSLGVDAVLATPSGRDTYGARGILHLPFVAWGGRRSDDVCIVPDVYSRLADEVDGAVVVFEQNPIQVRRDFDYLRPNVRLWSCSPLMTEQCRRILPGNEPIFAPVIVDPEMFPFIAPERRQSGRLAALPRKQGMEFIQATYRRYRAEGGRYWKLDLIDGLSFHDFALRFRLPQALLTATDVEGCALPGMEAMAGGMVVAGKDARGASFYMRDGENALIANTAESASAALCAIEDPQLRQRLAQAAYDHIQRFFPDAEPRRFWEGYLCGLETGDESRRTEPGASDVGATVL